MTVSFAGGTVSLLPIAHLCKALLSVCTLYSLIGFQMYMLKGCEITSFISPLFRF